MSQNVGVLLTWPSLRVKKKNMFLMRGEKYLFGPFPLSQIDAEIVPGLIGAYVLSRDGRYAHYVGRSDDDLLRRIKSSAKEGRSYRYFWFAYADSPWAAYQLELKWCQEYQPIDNTNKPAMPSRL